MTLVTNIGEYRSRHVGARAIPVAERKKKKEKKKKKKKKKKHTDTRPSAEAAG